MTLMIFEMKRCRMSLAVWATSISLLLLICLVIFPDMKDQVNELNAAFSSMGGFTEAFGMDRLNFGDLMGFYGLECGNILGIGGAFFAAYIGVSSLACEEKDRTAEFLLTHPVSRFRIVFEKMLCIFWQILILNTASILTSAITIYAIGETLKAKEFLLLHAACFLLQAEIAAICSALSAVLRRSGVGAGLCLTAIFYFLNIVANITEKANWLKYITPFGYAEAADIIADAALNPIRITIGCAVTAVGIASAFIIYIRKDIH